MEIRKKFYLKNEIKKIKIFIVELNENVAKKYNYTRSKLHLKIAKI